MPEPLRLGFAVKALGQPGLKSNDSRRWQSGPHLRVSIGYLREIFAFLDRQDIRMYRMSSDVAPYVTHPGMPQFHGQIAECRGELRELGALARSLDLRLSFHPSQYIVLNSPDPALAALSRSDVTAQAEILDLMDLGQEAVVVVHVGGAYDDRAAGRERWAASYETLPEPARRRLVLENDDTRYSSADVLWVHERTGVRLIFDYQHHWCNNPEGLDLIDTCGRFLGTWPPGVRPKIHYSSARTEAREVKRRDRTTGKTVLAVLPPVWTGHADFVNPFEFIAFMNAAGDLEFDVMLEAKAKDLALLRLREDLRTYAPGLAQRFAPLAAAR